MSKSAEEIMANLWDVGWEKPMGYLPIQTIEACGWDIDMVAKRVRGSDLATEVFAEGDCHTVSGALYVWHTGGVQRLLNLNVTILEKSGWPKKAGPFVREVSMRIAEKDSDIFDLVGVMFADARMNDSPRVYRP